MQNWSDFYFLCGSSAAGLTGLMFVAVTFGNQLVRKDNMLQVNTFVTPICFHFIQVFILCCIASVPGVPYYLMAAATFLPGLIRGVSMPQAFITLRKSSKKDSEIEMSDWVFTLALPFLIHVSFIVTGVLFFRQNTFATDLLAINMITLLAVAVRSAWDMIIFFATKIEKPHDKSNETSTSR